MSFVDEINYLEHLESKANYIICNGKIPILFSAPHTITHIKENGFIKLSEPYTKAVALYLNKYFDTFAIIKNVNDGLDSNRDNNDTYKKELINLIKENDIKIVIDLHGASIERNFDVELGTLNNLSADFSTIRELEEAFKENDILEVVNNDPFKGGAITQYIYNLKDVDVIQIEINGKYRDSNNLELLKKIIESLSNFIKQYNDYVSDRTVYSDK